MGMHSEQTQAALTQLEQTTELPAARGRTRAKAQIDFAAALLDAGRVEESVGQPALDNAIATYGANLNDDGLAAAVEARLAPFADVARQYTIHCVGHAHIDMNWMWNWPETVGTTIDTFTTVDALMEEYPDFTFSQSQASVYRILEQHAPWLLDRVRQRIREGRWEVTASTWVEGDKNLACGEDLCRQQLLTRRYFQKLFGEDAPEVQIDFEPDLFGHPATAPMILGHGGARYMYFMRCGKGKPMFWFEAPNGSRLLAFDIGCYTGYNGVISTEMAGYLMDYEKKTGLRDFLFLFGVGDHGGGPTRRDIETALWMQNWPVWPKVEFSTQHRFFKTVEAQGDNLPVIREELNYIFEGCYTTQCRIKFVNRMGPVLLYEAELWSAIAARSGVAPEYPSANFREAWEKVCFNQFHDILPGSGVPATVEYAGGLFQEVQAVAHSATSRALRLLDHAVRGLPEHASRPDASEGSELFSRSEGAGVGLRSDSGRISLVCRGRGPVRNFTAFNPSPWERGGLVSIRLWDLEVPTGTELVAGHPGRCLRPIQAVGEGHYWGHQYREILFPACQVPGCGYATCRIGPRPLGAELEAPQDPVSVSGTTGFEDHNFRRADGGIGIENRRVRLSLDPVRARISGLVDKRSGRDLISPTDLASLLVLYREAPHGMTAWRIGTLVDCENVAWENAVVTERGPYRASIRCPFSFSRSHGALSFSLDNDSSEVRMHLELHWLEHGNPNEGVPFLKLRLPVALDKAKAVFTTPFGSIKHPARDQETPSIGRVTLAETAGGKQALTVLADSKYGFHFNEGVLETSLVRGSYDPDPYPDLGVHHVEIGLRLHAAGLAEGAIQRAAFDFVHPFSTTENYRGEGEVRGGYLAVGPQNILVAAVKKPEDGEGLVLRLYETESRDTEAMVMLDPRLKPTGLEAWTADVHERPLEQLTPPAKTGALRVPVKASSLCTLLLRGKE